MIRADYGEHLEDIDETCIDDMKEAKKSFGLLKDSAHKCIAFLSESESLKKFVNYSAKTRNSFSTNPSEFNMKQQGYITLVIKSFFIIFVALG